MLHLVRHGRTTANAQKRLLGRLDPPLDEVGEGQADAVAADLASRLGRSGAAVVVSSPLRRTRQTAERVANALGAASVVVDDRWVELDYGELDGVALRDVPADLWDRWRSDAHFRPPGGETLAEVDARVALALEELSRRNGDIVVVSHVSPIKAAVAWILGVPGELAWRLFLAPATITTATLGPGPATLHSFNAAPNPTPDARPPR